MEPLNTTALKTLLADLELIATGGSLTNVDPKKIAASLALALSEQAVMSAAIFSSLEELRGRIALVASAMLAGDTLIQRGSLLLPTTARVLEQFVTEEARRAADSRGFGLDLRGV